MRSCYLRRPTCTYHTRNATYHFLQHMRCAPIANTKRTEPSPLRHLLHICCSTSFPVPFFLPFFVEALSSSARHFLERYLAVLSCVWRLWYSSSYPPFLSFPFVSFPMHPYMDFPGSSGNFSRETIDVGNW